jgi:type II secretory pathway predicted ATPase ExeA
LRRFPIKPDPGYNAILGLQKSPFSSEDDRTFFYAFPSIVQRLNVLSRLIQGRDFLIMVIGEKGSGKTALLNQFLISAKGNWRTCRIRAHSKAIPDRKSALDNLNEHPAFILPDDEPPIVLFDDAHELTEIELQYLLKDALAPGGDRKLKRLILFSESSINATIASLSAPFTKETVVNKIHMPPLKESETQEYLFHRLKIAGLTGKNPFKSADIKSIHKAAGGLPGKINERAHTLLKNRFSDEESSSRPIWLSGLLKKIILLALGSITLFGLVIFLFFHKEESSNLSTIDLPGPKFQVSNHLKKKLKKPPAFAVSAAPSNNSEQAAQLLDKSEEKFGKNNSAVSVKSKDEVGTKKTKSSDLTSDKKKKRKTVSKTSKKGKKINRENWILAQNPSFYTIQLIGLQNTTAIYTFVKKYELFYNVAYYKTLYHKKDWYPLLYGVYPTRKEALAAMKNLPPEIGKFSPWIRTFSSIQQIIRSL